MTCYFIEGNCQSAEVLDSTNNFLYLGVHES